MTSALVVGEPGCGRTTFVGLLYTAVVRLGNEEADWFRFHAERESIRRLESIYGALGAGLFPPVDLEREGEPLRFVFGFRRAGLGRVARAHRATQGEFDAIPVQVADAPVAEVAELHERTPVLDEGTRRLLRSSVVVALVNAASLRSQRVGPDDGSAGPDPLQRYDRELAKTLRVVGGFLSTERSRKLRRLSPIFVLTQFDRLGSGIRWTLDAPTGAPSTWTHPDRAAFGSRLLARYLPETDRVLLGGLGPKVTVDAPSWFFSEVAVLDSEPSGTRIRRRSRLPAGGWEPEYPYEEYRALLLELGQHAHLHPAVVAE